MPDEAAGTASSEVGSVKEIKLTADKKPAYEITGQRDGLLLGFIPVKLDILVVVSADTGRLESVQKPWWSFLVMI
jgi:hypothetical protein